MKGRSFLILLSLVALGIVSPAVSMASLITIGDAFGNIGTVDTSNGDVSEVFNPTGATDADAFTDIAYDPLGNLWGISFFNLYSIDVAEQTATNRGAFFESGSDFLNAFTFGADGTAYAMGGSTTSLYTLDLDTGMASDQGDVGYFSVGDLAFDDMGSLYLSAKPASDGIYSRLVRIDMTPTISVTYIGDLEIGGIVPGLDFTDGKMFGAAGTQVFEIDLSDASIDNEISFVDGGLSTAYGASAPAPVPEPATMLLFGAGLAAFAGLRRRFRAS